MSDERLRVDDIWLFRRGAALPPGERVSAGAAMARVRAELPAGWGDDRALAEICLSLEGSFPGSGAPERDHLERTLQHALEDGRIVALRIPIPAADGAVGEKEEEKVAPPPKVREEKTWVEIVLTDDDDPPQPVPYAKYRIELPDGSAREGILGANGRAKIVGLDPGECVVTFPEIDAREWS